MFFWFASYNIGVCFYLLWFWFINCIFYFKLALYISWYIGNICNWILVLGLVRGRILFFILLTFLLGFHSVYKTMISLLKTYLNKTVNKQNSQQILIHNHAFYQRINNVLLNFHCLFANILNFDSFCFVRLYVLWLNLISMHIIFLWGFKFRTNNLIIPNFDK